LAKRELTEVTLKYAVKTKQIVWKSKKWWEVYTKGINPKLGCLHSKEYREANPEITNVVC